MKTLYLMICVVLTDVFSVFADGRVIIDYFNQAGCEDCRMVAVQTFPVLKERFEGFYIINEFDINSRSNLAFLVICQEYLSITNNEPVCIIVDRSRVLNGLAAIQNGLLAAVDQAMAERAVPGWTLPPALDTAECEERGVFVAERRLNRFTLPLAALGGLLDGINPCAIGTMVFLMSMLAVSGVGGRALAVLGMSYCFASFATYMAIGFGFLHALHRLEGFIVVRAFAEFAMVLLLLIFAALSFIDAMRYYGVGKSADLVLQLPMGVKKLVHNIMRVEFRRKNLIVGGLVAGILVTIFESVCTGQIYLPVLIMVARTNTGASLKAWGYLLVYNTLFILPLVAVFFLFFAGTSINSLTLWSKRNVLPSKIMLGLFFIVLAIFLLMT